MTAQVSAQSYVFQDTKNNKPNTVHEVANLDAYIVNYNDNAGQKQTRIVLRVPGTDLVYVLAEKIASARVIVHGNDWFNKQVSQKIRSSAKRAETGAVSPEGVDQV
jgi:hypothetical protein